MRVPGYSYAVSASTVPETGASPAASSVKQSSRLAAMDTFAERAQANYQNSLIIRCCH